MSLIKKNTAVTTSGGTTGIAVGEIKTGSGKDATTTGVVVKPFGGGEPIVAKPEGVKPVVSN